MSPANWAIQSRQCTGPLAKPAEAKDDDIDMEAGAEHAVAGHCRFLFITARTARPHAIYTACSSRAVCCAAMLVRPAAGERREEQPISFLFLTAMLP